MPDHADRRRAPFEDLGRDALEGRGLVEEAEERGRLLADLGEEAGSRFARRTARRLGLERLRVRLS